MLAACVGLPPRTQYSGCRAEQPWREPRPRSADCGGGADQGRASQASTTMVRRFIAVGALNTRSRSGCSRGLESASRAQSGWSADVVSPRLTSWRSDGWSGRDAPQVQVVDYVSGDLTAQHREQSAIGYQVFIYEFMAAYNRINPEYKERTSTCSSS
jgi:hypothetical protein